MPEIDRTSEDDVRAMMERLIPDEEERLACCEALAETITYANQCKPSCWGVTAFPDGLRMNVSNKQVFVLGLGYGPDKVHLTVETSLLEPVREELAAQGVTFKPWSADLPDAEQVTLPSAKGSILLPLLLESLLGCVQVLAERVKTQTNLAKYHSPGVIAYLQRFLNEELPEPVYQEGVHTGEPLPEAAVKDWRVELQHWLSEGRSRTMPPAAWQLHEDFIGRFPRQMLDDMVIEQYTMGKPDSFCYWLEFKTKKLGGIGGGSSMIKFGVYWSQGDGAYRQESRFSNPEEAFAQIRGGIVTLIDQAEAGDYASLDDPTNILYTKRNMRGKLLYLYFPDRFLPMFSKGDITLFLGVMGQTPMSGDVMALNRQLWEAVFSQAEFSDFDGRQAMDFFYHKFPPDRYLPDPVPPVIDNPPIVINVMPPKDLKPLLDMAGGQPPRTRNILLYGPPGTGKTWLVTHFATYFLLSHNVSPARAAEYWQAVEDKDQETVQRLQAEARAGTARFWSICEDEAGLEWTWDTLGQGGEGFYDDRGITGVGGSPQEGDFVFGYRSGVRQYVAVARVTQGRHVREKAGREVQSIGLGDVTVVTRPVRLQTIKSDSRVQPPSQLAVGMHKPVFALGAEEASALTEAVEAANRGVLPDGFGESFLDFVTFHQSFTKEEFVERLRPETLPDGGIEYRVRPGVFRRICERARKQKEKRFLLVLDEINRANIAKVLGELITLIEDDKRVGEANEIRVTLPYSGERFGVPDNLTILGTMNTADRSIALLDLALRRRFTFVEMPPDPSLLEPIAGVNLRALLERLNGRVSALLDRDHRIGHSYLMNVLDEGGLHFAWYRRVVPLLQEYFHGDGERLRAALGGDFVREVKPDADARAVLGGAYDEAARYEVVPLGGADFLAALRRLAGGVVMAQAAEDPPEEEEQEG